MGRVTTKNDLLYMGNKKYNDLIELINSIPENDRTGVFTFDTTNDKEAHWKRDRNIKDILIHLYEWHQLLLNWVDLNQKGISKQFLQEGYNWKTYGDMNIGFWKEHQNTSYDASIKMLEESNAKIIKLAEKFSNDELFSKDVFDWVGGSTLGSYFVSVTSSHYDWAMKKIKRYKKQLGL